MSLGWSIGRHAKACQLQTPPLPTSGHCPCRLALLPVPLSLRLVEEMLLERGIVVSYETSVGCLQRFTSIFSAVRNLVVPLRSHRSALAPTCIASGPWQNEKPRQVFSPE